MKNCVGAGDFKIVCLEVDDFVVIVYWGCCLVPVAEAVSVQQSGVSDVCCSI